MIIALLFIGCIGGLAGFLIGEYIGLRRAHDPEEKH